MTDWFFYSWLNHWTWQPDVISVIRVILCSTSCSTNCFYMHNIYISELFHVISSNCIHQQQNQGTIIPMPGTSPLYVSGKNKFLIHAFGFINLLSYLLYLLYYQQNLLKMNMISLFYLRVGFNLECENLEFFKSGGYTLVKLSTLAIFHNQC